MNAEVDFFNNISYVDEAAKQPLRKVSVSESVGQPNWRRYTNGAVFRILGAVAILSILTGAFYFQHFHDFYFPDSSTYVTPAVSLLSGHGFTDIAGDPETVRTPGYPLFILLFLWMKLDLKYLVILQHVLRELIILATTAITLRVTRSLRQALLAGVFLGIDLPLLEAANSILTELLFTAVLLCIFWLLWTESQQQESGWLRTSATGFLAGASVLIRPVSLFLFLPITFFLLLTHRTFRFPAVLNFLLCFTCLPLLWAGRNYSQTGHFTVSSITGMSMLFYRAAGTLAINDPGNFATNLEKRQQQLQAEACEEVKGLYPHGCIDFRVPQKETPDQSEYFTRLGRRIVLQHPFAYLKLATRGAGLMMLDGGASSFSRITGLNPHLGLRLLLIYTLPMFCFVVVGGWHLWRDNRRLFYLSFLLISYFVIVSAGAEAYSRLRVPIDPICALLAAAGMEKALMLFQRLKRSFLGRIAIHNL